jgi:hypothetical protein
LRCFLAWLAVTLASSVSVPPGFSLSVAFALLSVSSAFSSAFSSVFASVFASLPHVPLD